MARVAVVTDSSACLPPGAVSGLDIYVVPLRLFINGTSYRDGLDITAHEVYRMLPEVRELPSTSAPAPSDFHDAMERASVGHDSVVVITMTSRFSGTYQSAVTAAAGFRESHAHVAVDVIDSGTAAGAVGLVVLNAARKAAVGGTRDEVCSAARDIMERVHLMAVLDTLQYLARSGRVPMAVHWANALVRVNPVFRIQPLLGEARTVRVARGRESAIQVMLELVRNHVGSDELHAVVFHSDRLEEAEGLRHRVDTGFRCKELYVSDFTPVMGIHTGPGVLGLAYYVSQ
jgi:DegV family protein with EDD domain